MNRLARLKSYFLLSMLAVPLMSGAGDNPHQADAEALAERQAMAASGDHRLSQVSVQADAVEPARIAGAMGVPPEQLRDAWLSGPARAAGVFTELGVIGPWSEEQFAALSTGIAGSPTPRPGTDLSGHHGDSDEVVLSLELEPPQAAALLTFRYRFLTTEFPAFAASGYNDEFTVTVSDADGRREIASIAADDKRIYPVSASRARGTGFDLFSDDPSSLSAETGSGMPAAGMSDWIQVRELIRTDGPVMLEFRIRDRGDKLMDSTVLLDDFSLRSGMLYIAPRESALSPAQQENTEELLTQCVSPPTPVPVDGAVTDAATRLLIIVLTPGPGSVEYILLGAGAPDDGGFLESVESEERLGQIVVPVVDRIAHARFLVADDFNRGGDENLATRPFSIHWEYFPDGDFPPGSGTITGKYKRPGVVLLHGLWSEGDTWRQDDFAVHDHPFLTVSIANYLDENAKSFDFNRRELDRWLLQVCNLLRAEGLGMRQADVVGHSMGGLLGRIYETTVRPGLVNRLITMNTPHAGSPLANAALFLAYDHPSRLLRFLFRRGAEFAGYPVDQGAIRDLAVGSEAINALAPVAVPSHALVGIGGRLFTDPPLEAATGDFCRILGFFGIECSEIFEFPEHDLVVGRDSQIGGIVPGAFSVFDGLDSLHLRVTKSANYSSRILDSSGISLLNARSDGVLFGQFPAPGALQSAQADPAFDILQEEALSDVAELTLVSPESGAEATSGKPVAVILEAPAGFEMQRAIVVSEVHVAAIDQAPFEADIPVPLDFVGALELTAFGANEAGEFAVSETLFLQVIPDAELLGIEITTPDPTIASFESQRRISVSGFYDDGVARDLSDPSTGTVYSSSNPSVATVTEDGVILPIQGGFTTVIAENAGFQDSITVRVLERDPPPPEEVDVSASPEELWPPDNRMVPVELAVSANGQALSGCAISGVSANEDDISGDVAVSGDLSLELRATRLGAGEGRLYTIEVACTGSGASGTGLARVRVRHDQRP